MTAVSDAQPEAEFKLSSVAISAFAPATLAGLAQGAMAPVIVTSALQRGASTADAALVAALIGVAALLTNIPAGALATRVGERHAMLIASALSAVGLGLCLPDLGHGLASLLVYAAGVFLVGSAASVFNLARQAYLTEMVPLHMRARALSTLGGTLRIGMFLGPFAAAGAIGLIGLPGAYLFGLIAIALCAAIVFRVPDLEVSVERRTASLGVTSRGIVREYWRMFLTLGMGALLLSAIRQTRQSVIPLWASHIGLSPTTSSLIYGIAGAVDVMTFYPSGKVMDLYGRRAIAVPSSIVLGISFVLLPLTHGETTLLLVALLMGFGNGCGSGVLNTIAADVAPDIGRLTFFGIWRELCDAGVGLGPLFLSGVTAVAGLGTGIVLSGVVGWVAAAALWVWAPRRVASRR